MQEIFEVQNFNQRIRYQKVMKKLIIRMKIIKD
jgi:hypothetical protein